jgi:NAD-dependent deacetylase
MINLDDRVVDALRKAKRVVVLTGAGVSAESGVPTFRDRQTGLWEKFDAAELATPSAFRRDPALVWGWYEWRRAIVLRAQPNAAHRAIAAMAELVPTFTLVTQNVDDLHERAGSRQVLHLHGELARPYCEGCRHPHLLALAVPEMPDGGCRIEPPKCAGCGGRIRPGVVWFGESLPDLEWLAAKDAAKQCDVFLCVGTSSLVQPAASLTTIASRAGAVTVQVNSNATDLDAAVTCAIRGQAGDVLPRIVSQTWGTDSNTLLRGCSGDT